MFPAFWVYIANVDFCSFVSDILFQIRMSFLFLDVYQWLHIFDNYIILLFFYGYSILSLWKAFFTAINLDKLCVLCVGIDISLIGITYPLINGRAVQIIRLKLTQKIDQQFNEILMFNGWKFYSHLCLHCTERILFDIYRHLCRFVII